MGFFEGMTFHDKLMLALAVISFISVVLTFVMILFKGD